MMEKVELRCSLSSVAVLFNVIAFSLPISVHEKVLFSLKKPYFEVGNWESDQICLFQGSIQFNEVRKKKESFVGIGKLHENVHFTETR